MRNDASPRRAKKVKKKAPPVYVAVTYPVWLGVASLAWAMVGWGIAAVAPHLAYVPAVGALHYLFPAVTVGLIAANLVFAVRDMVRGAHVLRLMVVTGLQVALFTTLFFQLYAHAGASLYDATGPTAPWQWVTFSLAHAFRAADLIDGVEAFGMKIQPIRHASAAVGVFVIAYHVVVDVFFLNLVWAAVGRVRREMLEDDGIRFFVRLGVAAGCGLWLLACLVYVPFFGRWSAADGALWVAENVLRVVDFADVLESFNLRLHGIPREGFWYGVLTALCRVWVGLAIMALYARKRTGGPRRVLTPPGADALRYWLRRVGALGGMAAAVLVTGLFWHLVAGNPAPKLAAAVGGPSDGRTADALRALRRMGPAAGDVVPALVEARAAATPDVRDEITRTLGYLGPKALSPLAEIAEADADGTAVAVEALGRVGPAAAPPLAKVWSATRSDEVKAAADAQLRAFGADAVPALMTATTAANADTHYHWFGELDRNWQLRVSPNQTATALQALPDHLRTVEGGADDEDLAAAYEGVAACGSAAQRAVPSAVKHITHRHGSVATAARSIVTAAGPRATRLILAELDGKRIEPGDQRFAALVGLLADPRMWDAATLGDGSAVPFVTTLINHHDPRIADGGRQILLSAIGAGGRPGRQLVPVLVGLLGDPNPDRRAEVRAALAKIDPDWRKNPNTGAAIPALLPRLTLLPRDEADELVDALGDLPESQGEAFVRAFRTEPAVYGDDQTREERGRQQEAMKQAMFDAVVRLRPKLRAAGPAVVRALKDYKRPSRYEHSHYAVVHLVNHIEAFTPVTPEVFEAAAAVEDAHSGERLTALAKKAGPAALPYLLKRLEGDRKGPVEVLAAMGPAAKDAVPALLKCLTREKAAVSHNTAPAETRLRIVRALDAIDADWRGRPDTGRTFVEIAEGIPGGRWGGDPRADICKFLGEMGPAAKPAVPAILKHLRADDGRFDKVVAAALDRIDPDWRKHPDVAAAVPVLIGRLKDGQGQYWALIQLQAEAVPHLEKAIAEGDPKAQDRALAVLAAMGPVAKPAVPAAAKVLAHPDRHFESAREVMAVLAKIDKDWADQPGMKEYAPKLLAEVARQPGSTMRYAEIAKVLGGRSLPEVVKQLADPKTEIRGAALATLKALGPKAKEATPAVIRLLKDKEWQVTAAAAETLGEIAAGDKAIVEPLVGVLEADYNTQSAAIRSLDKAVPGWRKGPELGRKLAAILPRVKSPKIDEREAALGVLGQLGEGRKELIPPLLDALVADTTGQSPTILRVLAKVDPDYRKAAAFKPALARLLARLSSPERITRHRTLHALKEIGPLEGVVPALEQYRKTEKDFGNGVVVQNMLIEWQRMKQ